MTDYKTFKLLNKNEQIQLADFLEDTPENVITRHLLYKGYCRTYLKGEITNYKALIIQSDFCPDELTGYGDDTEALWSILQSIENWSCVEIE